MAKDNVSKYIMLGLLSLKPMSGYDIKYWISNGVGHFWSISYGQIYPTLKDFIEEGLVTFKTERQEGRPEKKIYTISEKGQEELKNWLRGPIDFESGSYGGIFKVKVFFGANVEKDVTIKHIADVLEYENKKLAELLIIEQRMNQNREKELESGDQSFIYRLSILQEGISAKRAQIRWCEETILNLEKECD